MSQTNPPGVTTLSGGLWMQKTDGTYVQCIGADGSIDAPITTTDLTTTGTTTLGNGDTDTTTVKSTASSAFTVGPTGATKPTFQVDASTASVVTGLKVTGAATGAGLAVAVVETGGTNNALTLDAMGSGTVTINGTATGAITLARATGVTGALTVTSAGAGALSVGRLGATTPALVVDASAATSITGLKVASGASGAGVALSTIGETNVAFALNAAGSGTIGLNTTAGHTGTILLGNGTDLNGVSIQGPSTISSASTGALNVGPNGTTNPTLHVDASTASAATGLSITSAAAAGGLAVAVISSGTDENLTLNAKGAGTVTINGTATGNIVMGRAMTGVSSSMTGAVTAKSGTAVPATAGAVAAGAPLVMNSNGITIECTTDVPTHARPVGSICINLGGNSTSTRMYISTNAGGTWTAFTTAA